MNRLNETESAVFKLRMLYFQRISFQIIFGCSVSKGLFSDYLELTTAFIVPCGSPKKSPLHRYSVVIFTFSGPLGLSDSTPLFGNNA